MVTLPHILLVDDDETTNFLNQLLFKRLGAGDRLRMAHSAEQALALLAQSPPSEPTLLLLDVNMPGMGGIEFFSAYQRLPQAQREATVVVMLTTSLDARDLSRLHDLPIAGRLSKPLTREKIETLLRLHFQQQLPAK